MSLHPLSLRPSFALFKTGIVLYLTQDESLAESEADGVAIFMFALSTFFPFNIRSIYLKKRGVLYVTDFPGISASRALRYGT